MPLNKDKKFWESEAYLEKLPDAVAGKLLKEYVKESQHNGWDGFNRHDLTGIRKVLSDMCVYHESADAGNWTS